MSAWLVSKEHLYLLVYKAMHHRGAGSVGIRWYYEKAPRKLGPFDYDEADRLVALLDEENRKSLRYRYEDAESMFPEAPPPGYPRTLAFATEYTPAETLKAISCYEYQTCEHSEWEASEAHAFCQALRDYVITEVAGYDDAPWGIEHDEFEKRRGGVVSLSGLIGTRRRST